MPGVLIAEDNEDILEILSLLMESEGHEVWRSTDGLEAEELALEHIPDLAIIDLMMPGKNGLDLCHDLRNNPLTAHTKLIVLTALNHQEAAAMGGEIQVDAFISKPFDIDALIQVVDALLES